MAAYRHKKAADLPAICREWRRSILEMLTAAQSGHPGGSLSLVEIMAELFLRQMKHDPANPQWRERDRLILSKGHGVPALYAALAYTGYFPQPELMTLRKIDSRLQGHPDRRVLPGVEASTGSLGQGLSIGIGHALAAKLDKLDYRTFVVMGDGETQEGQVWEAAMFAAGHRLANLTAVIDANSFQLDGLIEKIMPMEPMAEKWQSFGWAVRDIDGHNLESLAEAFDWARRITDKPSLIIARTVKGKGVSFMENENKYHGVAPSEDELKRALEELK